MAESFVETRRTALPTAPGTRRARFILRRTASEVCEANGKDCDSVAQAGPSAHRGREDATVLAGVKGSPATRAGFTALDPVCARSLTAGAGDGRTGASGRGSGLRVCIGHGR